MDLLKCPCVLAEHVLVGPIDEASLIVVDDRSGPYVIISSERGPAVAWIKFFIFTLATSEYLSI